MAYQIRLKFDTWLKQATVQGGSLPESQRQFLNGATVLPISGFELEGNHLRVTLGKDGRGDQIFYKGRNTWFVYEPAVELLRNGQVIDPQTLETNASAYTMAIELDTWLKQSTAQGSRLPDDQRQLVRAGTVLPVERFTDVGSFHLQVALGVDAQGKQVSFKGKTTWYVYRPVVELRKNDNLITVPPPVIRGENYTLAFQTDTLLKQSTAQGFRLPESQKQFISAGTSLPILKYEVADAAHWKVWLGLDPNGKQIIYKGRTSWIVYRPAVELLKDGVPVEKSLVGKTIVLDPGHGEFSRFGVNDPGAVNARLGRNERDEVRKQANIIQKVLSDKGANVRIIENNTSLSLNAIGGQGRGADCFVSLHLNAIDQTVQGHEVFVFRTPTAADVRLGNAVNQALNANFADGDVPDRGVKRAGLAVLAGVPPATPAILTEAFFIDSVRSAAVLDRWNGEAARAIAQGIEKFLVS